MSGTKPTPIEDKYAAETFDWGDEVSTFGDRLARARTYSQMDQSELARRLGVKLVTVRNWETDRSEPRSNRLQMLSGLLNISIIWLMTGEGEGVPDEEEAIPASRELHDLLAELRQLQVAQTRLAKQTGLIEKQLRALIAPG